MTKLHKNPQFISCQVKCREITNYPTCQKKFLCKFHFFKYTCMKLQNCTKIHFLQPTYKMTKFHKNPQFISCQVKCREITNYPTCQKRSLCKFHFFKCTCMKLQNCTKIHFFQPIYKMTKLHKNSHSISYWSVITQLLQIFDPKFSPPWSFSSIETV